jgi:hypothetical protein
MAGGGGVDCSILGGQMLMSKMKMKMKLERKKRDRKAEQVNSSGAAHRRLQRLSPMFVHVNEEQR